MRPRESDRHEPAAGFSFEPPNNSNNSNTSDDSNDRNTSNNSNACCGMFLGLDPNGMESSDEREVGASATLLACPTDMTVRFCRSLGGCWLSFVFTVWLIFSRLASKVVCLPVVTQTDLSFVFPCIHASMHPCTYAPIHPHTHAPMHLRMCLCIGYWCVYASTHPCIDRTAPVAMSSQQMSIHDLGRIYPRFSISMCRPS